MNRALSLPLAARRSALAPLERKFGLSLVQGAVLAASNALAAAVVNHAYLPCACSDLGAAGGAAASAAQPGAGGGGAAAGDGSTGDGSTGGGGAERVAGVFLAYPGAMGAELVGSSGRRAAQRRARHAEAGLNGGGGSDGGRTGALNAPGLRGLRQCSLNPAARAPAGPDGPSPGWEQQWAAEGICEMVAAADAILAGEEAAAACGQYRPGPPCQQ
jgi:hypothetical protein